MNKVILFGNVGKDPEVKHLESNKVVAKFSLATNKSYTNQSGEKITDTSWHNIVLWGKLAELAEKYVKKGNSVIIEGEINYRSWEDKEGVTKYMTEIIGDKLHFAGGKKEETKDLGPTAKDEFQGGSATKEAIVNASRENIPPNDDLPF